MKNINDKTKKRFIIAGGILISVVLIFMISTRFQKEPVIDAAVPQTSADTSEVVVDESKAAESAEKEEVTVPPIKGAEAPSVGNGADDTGTEQTIQEDIPAKPTYTEEQLTDPTQKPNGEKVDPPKEEDETPKAPAETLQTTEQKPSGGLPGFDNVPDGGGNQVINGESDGDINTQVGTMD